MDLIAILVVLGMSRFLPTDSDWRLAQGFRRYAAWLQARLAAASDWNTALPLLLLLVPPVLVVALLQFLLAGRLAGTLSLLLSITILFACLPALRPDRLISGVLRAWRQDDTSGARTLLDDAPEPGAAAGDDASDDALLPEQAARRTLGAGGLDLLALLFWFVLLGPLGAVAWRTADTARELTRNHGPGDTATSTWHHWLGWIPARMMTAGYGLMGNLAAVMDSWKAAPGEVGNDELMQRAAMASLPPPANHDRDADEALLREARSLLRRTLLFWLVVLALLTIVGLA